MDGGGGQAAAAALAADGTWWRDALRDILSGTVGGLLGRLIEYPFDTVKVKLQAGNIGSAPQYSGAISCFVDTIRREGPLALYRGMALPLGATIIETATLFLTNGALKRSLRERGHLSEGEELPMPMVLLAGGGTGFFVSFVLTPIELVKCRMQVSGVTGPGGRMYAGPLDCLAQSIARDGLSVVYRGHLATMLREIPGTAGWFGAYESFARYMTPPGATRQDLPASTIITAGALGGMAYWALMYPCDTVKSAMQISDGPMNTATAASPSPFPPPSSSPVVPPSTATSAGGVKGPATPPTPTTWSAVTRLPPPLMAGAATAGGGGGGGTTLAHFTTSAAMAAGVSPSSPNPPKALTFVSTFRAIYRMGGVRALYAGFIPTLLRAAPSNAAIFVGYEWANTQLKQLF